LLDELARHDDRLLRDNEPRIEGAAKTMLTDWTRRRILSFVPPPKERLGDKNKKVTREEKRKAITDVTDNPVITVEEQGKEWPSIKEEVWGGKACLLGVRALAIALPAFIAKARGVTEVFVDEGAEAS
jgi:hypothetical protein